MAAVPLAVLTQKPCLHRQKVLRMRVQHLRNLRNVGAHRLQIIRLAHRLVKAVSRPKDHRRMSLLCSAQRLFQLLHRFIRSRLLGKIAQVQRQQNHTHIAADLFNFLPAGAVHLNIKPPGRVAKRADRFGKVPAFFPPEPGKDKGGRQRQNDEKENGRLPLFTQNSRP